MQNFKQKGDRSLQNKHGARVDLPGKVVLSW